MFFLQMAGFPGSGKSTLARAIAREIHAVILDHDVVKTALLESLGLEVDTRRVGGYAYHVEWTLIEFHLSQGLNVILDSPCLYDGMPSRGEELCLKYAAKYKFIECANDDYSEINRRLQTRNRMLSQIDRVPSDEVFFNTLKSSKVPEHSDWLQVDTSKPLSTYLPTALNYVSR